MIPYMSYWCGGYRKKPSEIILLMHKIACHFAKQHYGECHMLTDSDSKDVFQNCGFTSVQVIPEIDNIPKEYGITWSLGKLYCFKHLAQNNIRFLHLDYDVFLFKKLPKFIENAGIFVQNKEPNCAWYYEVDDFLKHCEYGMFDNMGSLDAYNMGIFGGKDSEFILDYCNSSLNLVFNKKNKCYFTQKTKNSRSWSQAVIAEQWALACCEKFFNKKITSLFEDDRVDSNAIPYEEDCKKYGYCHIWGAKNSEYWQHKIKQIAEKLNIK